MTKKQKISLVLADVDGTLVTEEKVLTKRAQAAVQSLREAGVRFAITSGRPPMGMAMLFDALKLDTPIAGFNGGLVIKPDLTILEQKTVPADVAAKSIELIRAHGADFSIVMTPVRPAIQARLPTPTANIISISAQQQPRQKSPWRRPSSQARPAPRP